MKAQFSIHKNLNNKNSMTVENCKLKIFLIAILPIVTSPLFTQKAYGEGLHLKLSPSTLQIQAQTPADVKAPFTIENQSNQSVKLKIGYKVFNPKSSQEGKIVFLDEQNSGAKQKIFDSMQIVDTNNVSVNSLELGPKQQKKLKLKILIPQNQPSSDNYFSLIFLNDLQSNIDQKTSKDY